MQASKASHVAYYTVYCFFFNARTGIKKKAVHGVIGNMTCFTSLHVFNFTPRVPGGKIKKAKACYSTYVAVRAVIGSMTCTTCTTCVQ